MSLVLRFPMNGIHKGANPDSPPENTTFKCANVRPYWQGRFRGGQRPGLGKWSTTQVGGTEQPVVAITSVHVVESP